MECGPRKRKQMGSEKFLWYKKYAFISMCIISLGMILLIAYFFDDINPKEMFNYFFNTP